MPNSTINLQAIVDSANSFGDLAPALATGGYSDAPALDAANDVMAAMLFGGPDGQPFNWKWNRFNVTPFTTITLQQDYFVPGAVNVSWLEYAWASNINSTSIPKEKVDLETRRDLLVTYSQTGYPDKICWIPNDQAIAGTWGQTALTSDSGLTNPGPGVKYINPINQVTQPNNPTTCIKDPNGNLWCLTQFGVCGSVQPTWPTSPVYPTLNSQNLVATTVTDGSCIWTAINPKGQAFRLNPTPPQTGVVWMINVVAQMRAPTFLNLAQTLEPIPDDYVTFFKQGFYAQCFRRSPDPKVRAKFKEEYALWLKALDNSLKSGQREMDDFGFYPSSASVMETGWAGYCITPARPYGPF